MGFPEDTLKAHNSYRSKHGVSSLKLNKEITTMAQKWAEHLASTGTFSHSQDRAYKGDRMGENIAMKWTSNKEDFTGEQVTEQWYSEVEKYDFNRNSGAGTGHFTQVVWKGSNEFGIGKAQGKDGKWIVVANYFPAGNFLGRFADNVFPAGTAAKSGGLFSRFKKDKEPEPSSTVVRSTQPYAGSRDLSSGGSGGGSVSRATRTERITEDRGQGRKTYTKSIVTETRIDAQGNKHVSTKETETTEDAGASGGFSRSSDFDRRFKELEVDRDNNRNNYTTTYSTRTASSDDKKDKKDKKEKEKKPQKIKDFIDDVVKSHNKYRKSHNKVGDLKHNKELSVLAQRWADHLATSNVLKHSNDTYKGDSLGENVATKWSSAGAEYTGQEVTEQWYSENTKYNFNNAVFTPGTGHFTQVVWKGSREVGVGKAHGKDGRVYVVCNYFPAGNVQGQFGDNVSPSK